MALNYYFVFIGDLREYVEPDFANEFKEELPSLFGSVNRLAEIFAPLTIDALLRICLLMKNYLELRRTFSN